MGWILLAMLTGLLLLFLLLRALTRPQQQEERGGQRVSYRLSIPVEGTEERLYVNLRGLLGYYLWLRRYYGNRHGVARTTFQELALFVRGGPSAVEQSRGYKSYIQQLMTEDKERRKRAELAQEKKDDGPVWTWAQELQLEDDGGDEEERDGTWHRQHNLPLSSLPLQQPPAILSWENLAAIEAKGGNESAWALIGMIGWVCLLDQMGEALSRTQMVEKKKWLSSGQYAYLIGSPEWSETKQPGLLRRAGIVSYEQESQQSRLLIRDQVQIYLEVASFLREHPHWQDERPGQAQQAQNGRDSLDRAEHDPLSNWQNEREVAGNAANKERERNWDDNEYDDDDDYKSDRDGDEYDSPILH